MGLTREKIEEIVRQIADGTMDQETAVRGLFTEIAPPSVKPSHSTVEIWVAINENDDLEAGATRDDAIERLTDNQGGVEVRVVRLTLRVPSIIDQELKIDLNTSGPGVEVVKE